MPRQKNEELIDPTDLKLLGRAWGGTHWQSDLAREIKCSKSFLTRATLPSDETGSRSADEDVLLRVRGAMISRVESIADKLDTEGLPYADDAKTARAMKMIKDACALLRSQTPKPAKKAA